MIKKRKAATLVEIVIYFMLLAVFLGVATSFSIQMIGASHSASNESDLSTELSLLRSKLSTAIQNAASVNSGASTFNDPNGVLSLSMPDVADDPTVIYWEDEKILMRVGLSQPTTLHSQALTIESLQFQIFSSDKVPDHIVVDAVVKVETDLDISDASSNFHLAVSLRP